MHTTTRPVTRHYWHTPTIPPTTPATATVVVRTACGGHPPVTMPLWQVREWERQAPPRDVTRDCQRCAALTAGAPAV